MDAAAVFGTRLQEAIHTIERLPLARRALGRRWLWYLYALLHHRRPPSEHDEWRAMVQASVERQELREEVRLMAQTIAESLYEQGVERGKELGIEQGRRDVLFRQVRTKFGAVPRDVGAWLDATIDLEELDRFSELLVRADSIDDLRSFAARAPRRKTRPPRSR